MSVRLHSVKRKASEILRSQQICWKPDFLAEIKPASKHCRNPSMVRIFGRKRNFSTLKCRSELSVINAITIPPTIWNRTLNTARAACAICICCIGSLCVTPVHKPCKRFLKAALFMRRNISNCGKVRRFCLKCDSPYI